MRLNPGLATALLALSLATAVPASHAASASAADMAALQHFTLTDDFLGRYLAVQKDIAKDPCRLGMISLLKGRERSLEQAAAAYDAQPGVHAMLASHGLTARKAIMGMSVLMAAAMQDLSAQHPGMVQGGGMAVSPANMAFYRAHKARIRQFNMQIGRQELEASGGKLPACMQG